jgi:large subunit ribosomal protein L21
LPDAAFSKLEPDVSQAANNGEIQSETEMYAILEACGRQYVIEAGRFVDLDLTAAEPGESITFENILMIVDGKDSHIGGPFVEGAKVTGKVIAHDRGPKIIVYHMRPKKGTRKKQGHRQGFTRVMIDKIELKDKVLAESKQSAGKEKAASNAKKKPAPDIAE